jgi:tRNA-binding protein
MEEKYIPPDRFFEVDLRVGRVLSVEEFPAARRPSYKLTVDLGSLGVRRSSAALASWYTRADLEGRLVVAVCNLPPRQVADMMSEVLLLGAVQEDGRVVLLQPDAACPPGTRIG